MPTNILTGADQMDQYLPLLEGQSVAVFANATSVVGNRQLVDTLLKKGVRIKKIFSPEHGFRGEAD
ncbi:MAG TPA: exo-beta-N-acetylmuramidase NamZ domain-containing protein, partial [Puia sp.]|nr:exo-beta-N-acetylmuramidase NamZ domain-containing protein [Puia sp.]